MEDDFISPSNDFFWKKCIINFFDHCKLIIKNNNRNDWKRFNEYDL